MGRIVIRGREYQVEKTPPEGPLDEGKPIYVLTGKSGKKWYTLRNKPNPQMMFLIPEAGFSKTMDRVWLTDRNGTLEVVSS
jgi:hypothetical protein